MVMETFLSIDVECVATGCGHLDRTPVSVAVVDMNESLLFDEKINPGCIIHSYLTELTGFTAEDFVSKRSLAEVMVDVRSFLGPNVVLIGQGIENDIRWLQLVEGTDYKRFIDLADLFTIEQQKHGVAKTIVHGLQHVASICLPDYEPTNVHSAAVDAKVSIKLFKLTGGPMINKKAMKAIHHKLRQAPRSQKSLIARYNYRLGDVCCAGYSKTLCLCRQPNIKEVLAGEYPYPFPVVTPAQMNEMNSISRPDRAEDFEPCESYPRSYDTILETIQRGGGRFNPHENYRDDYDNLYGDFHGNSGGKD